VDDVNLLSYKIIVRTVAYVAIAAATSLPHRAQAYAPAARCWLSPAFNDGGSEDETSPS